MEKMVNDLEKWLEELGRYRLPEWDNMPELDLYMDQVISYLEKKLAPLSASADKMITPFMINNYVKGNLIEAPRGKKYSREQLGYLFAICAMKPVLSISEIGLLFGMDENISRNKKDLYMFFKNIHDDAVHNITKSVTPQLDVIKRRYLAAGDKTTADRESMKQVQANIAYIAFRNSIVAEINKMIAVKLIDAVSKNIEEMEKPVVEEEKSRRSQKKKAARKLKKSDEPLK